MTARLAILDFGETLVRGPARGPWSRIAAALGLDRAAQAALRDALMTRPFGDPHDVAAFVGTLGDAGPAEVERVVGDVWTAQGEEAEPIPGGAEALSDLCGHGLRVAVISNIWLPYLQAVRRHYGVFLDDHVAGELQLLSFREGRTKPAPELFVWALERAGVAAGEAVMIGDSYAEDIGPAAKLGLGTVWVLHRPERERADMVRVLNGEAPAPGRAVPSIAELTADLVAAALPGAIHV